MKRRRPVRRGPHLTAAARNVRPIVRVYPHQAPDPPRQGDTPARPARVPIVTFQNRAGILSVMADRFLLRLRAPDPSAATPGFGSHPWTERANIRRPPAEAYGSQFGLDPTGKGMAAVPLAGVPS